MKSYHDDNDDGGDNDPDITMTKEERDQYIRDEIMTMTGMSHLMLHIYVISKDTKHVDTLDYVMWPNKDIISLGRANIDRNVSKYEAYKENNRLKSKRTKTVTTTTTTTKKSKEYNDDDIRKFIVQMDEKSIATLSDVAIDDRIVGITSSSKTTNNTIECNGEDPGDSFNYPWMYTESNAATMMDDALLHNNNHSIVTVMTHYKRDALLMYDYVGWGVTKTGCYVFVYYIGPEDKGVDYCELRKQCNWQVVPKSHLSHFHNHIKSYTYYKAYLNHTRFSIKQSKFIKKHIEYDARFIVSKWQKNGSVSKEHHSRIMDHKELFASLPESEYYIKVIQQRMKDEEDIVVSPPVTTSRILSPPPMKGGVSPPVTSSPDKKKYSSLTIDNYPSISQYPLGRGRVGFDKFVHLVTHIVENPNIPPKEYEWDVKDLINYLLIALNGDLHARSVISGLFEQYNVSFDNYDTSHLANAMFFNEDAKYDIKQATSEYVCANMTVDFLTRSKPSTFSVSDSNSYVL
jgi:hypothetical protein